MVRGNRETDESHGHELTRTGRSDHIPRFYFFYVYSTFIVIQLLFIHYSRYATKEE